MHIPMGSVKVEEMQEDAGVKNSSLAFMKR
jgi:hypothetical protein